MSDTPPPPPAPPLLPPHRPSLADKIRQAHEKAKKRKADPLAMAAAVSVGALAGHAIDKATGTEESGTSGMVVGAIGMLLGGMMRQSDPSTADMMNAVGVGAAANFAAKAMQRAAAAAAEEPLVQEAKKAVAEMEKEESK